MSKIILLFLSAIVSGCLIGTESAHYHSAKPVVESVYVTVEDPDYYEFYNVYDEWCYGQRDYQHSSCFEEWCYVAYDDYWYEWDYSCDNAYYSRPQHNHYY